MAAFKGFPRECVTFFENLKQNNSKDWFEKHRQDYEQFVMLPAREYVEAMGERLRNIAPAVHAIPKINKSLFKINRDVRFSQDKSPYKTYMGIWLWDGDRKRMECSGFYLHLENKMVMIGVGIKMFTKPLLELYRGAVADKKLGAELKKIVTKVSAKGYLIDGKNYKKIPRGFDGTQPNAEFLLYNGLTARAEEKVSETFFSDAILEHAYSHYKNMLPIHAWLKKALSQ